MGGKIMKPIEKILYGDSLLAIIIRSDFRKEGIAFFTPNDFSQRLAYMNCLAGHRILRTCRI